MMIQRVATGFRIACNKNEMVNTVCMKYHAMPPPLVGTPCLMGTVQPEGADGAWPAAAGCKLAGAGGEALAARLCTLSACCGCVRARAR